jgi:hypothetical protein
MSRETNNKLLVYGEIFEGLVFLEKGEAEWYAKNWEAIATGEQQRLTWGQFEEKYPEVYDWIFEFADINFDEWIEMEYSVDEENLEDSSDEKSIIDSIDLEKAKKEYKAFQYESFAKPLKEWPFEIKGGLIDSIYDPLQRGPKTNNCLPRDVKEKFGREDTFVEIWKIDPKFESEIIAELDNLEFVCEKNPSLISKACYGA